MFRFLLSIIAISIFFSDGYSQDAYISSALATEIKKDNYSESNYIRIIVVLKDQLDINTLKNEFSRNNTPASERAKIVLQKTTEIAQKSQERLFNEMESFNGSYKNLVYYWLVNMIVLDASPNFIKDLQLSNEVEIIDLDSDHLVNPINPIMVSENETKSVGGTEPGLEVINVPKLWAMGYTGRGRISFTLDTGVWPNHPSFGGRFLANYFPMDRAWLGFNKPLPYDKGNSHGTHVTGTTLGLDRATNDTIGAAFNAYFMASDPVATSLATVKPLSSFVSAFQWALNPDGDVATTDDIPDVINNSWGYDVPTDTFLCTSFASQMLETIELAGIANIFSAGNEGPGDSTISSPHHIVTGLVNSFTVGSISPHDTAFPISSFSSRGPSICPSSGAIAIKPEVVAPGYQIRSSVGQSSYATYNGTSMASPHVTGVVLLLKEAFPYLTGEEILLALYYSAHDLGIAGEDNTYGRGIIDAYAAFQYLSLTNTAVPPRSGDYDLTISEVIYPNKSFICDTIVIPEIQITNLGDSSISSVLITYWVNTSVIQVHQWSGNLLAGQSVNVILPSINTFGGGDKELKFQSVINNSIVELDDINNSSIVRFNVRPYEQLPYFEDFEFENLAENGWHIENPDNDVSWKTDTTGGLFGLLSAQVAHFDYFPKSNQKDDLLSPIFEFPNSGKFSLIFERAYMLKHNLFADTLKVFLISNCDLSQKTLVYTKGGVNLKTFDSTSHYFIPSRADQWATDTIDLSSYVGQGDYMIDFQTTNRFGNNIYIDNIRLFAGNIAPVSIKELNETTIYIFPNPTNSAVNLQYEENSKTNISIKLYDIYGKELYANNINSSQSGLVKIPLKEMSTGMYIIVYQTNNFTKSFKVVKQ